MARKGLRLTILAKMGASSLVMLALLLFVGYTGYDAIDKLEQNEVDVQRRSTLALESQGVDALMYKQGMYLRAYLLQGNEGDATEIKTTGQTTIGILDQLIKTANMAETKKQLETLKTMEQQYLEMTEDTITRYRTGSQTEALAKLSSEVLPHLQTMVAITEQFSADKDKAARETMVKADQEANGAQLVLIWVIGLSAVLFLGVAVGIARHLSVPLFRLAGVARLLAEGDLTACAPPLKRQDEIGDLTLAFNTMVDHMRSLVADIAHSSRQVAESAGELTQVTAQVSEATHDVTNAVSQVAQGAGQQSHAAQQAASIVVELHNAITQVAAGAEEQAVSAQSSSEAVESMVEAINRAGELAGSVSRSAHQATQAAQSGSATVSDSAAAMERVRQAVSTSAESIRSLEQFSSQIGEITRAITEIADQTNLLALNAAIEAARAGEQGRGFSVVAEEVRKLAERSGKSASEIGTLVQAIVRKTADAVADMELATREVREGTALTEKTSAALCDIADLVARTEKDVAQIATATEHLSAASKQVLETVNAVAAVTEENTAATEEMAAGASQVTDSIQSIAAVAQENAASAEEVTASMEELTAGAQSVAGEAETLGQIAKALQAAVSRFKVG